MKEMRRVLALVLCFVMLVGVVPVGALAADVETTAVDAAALDGEIPGSSESAEAAMAGDAASEPEESTGEEAATTALAETDPVQTTIAEAPAYITAIAVTTQPAKTVYDIGAELDTTGMVVTAVYSDGTSAEISGWYVSDVDMTTAGEKTVTVNYAVDGLTFQTTFTITVEEQPDAAATLTGITITEQPAVTEYLTLGQIDITGMVVMASYSDGTSVPLAYQALNGGVGYDLDFNAYQVGPQTVTVSYEGFTAEYEITITAAAENVTGFAAVELEAEAVADALAEEALSEYIAFDLNGTLTGESAQIRIQAPETWTEDAVTVYYINEEGVIAETIDATLTDGVITFAVTHFSAYVVGYGPTETTIERDPVKDTITDSNYGEKTVYVLVDSIDLAETRDEAVNFLIVSSNAAGNAYALGQSTTGVQVQIQAANSMIPLPYIETTSNQVQWKYYLQTYYDNEFYVLRNTGNDTYLRYNDGLEFNEWRISSWDIGENVLSYYDYRYVTCSNGTWQASDRTRNVYFYQEVTVPFNYNGEYSIVGKPDTISRVVSVGADNTVTLGSELVFVPESGATKNTDVSESATYTVESDPAGIISGISGNVLTFTGNKYGKALVKVSYTTEVDGKTITVSNYISVEAKAPYNDIVIHEVVDDTEGTKALKILPVKGVTADTTAVVTAALMQYSGGDTAVEDKEAVLTWSVVDDANGILDANAFTANSTSGTTATSKDSNVTLNFSGNGGIATIRVTYSDGSYADLTVTASKTDYFVPEDGTDDFPEYPDKGAVVIDKTATAVGDFNKTGIAQVELSMFGVPAGANPIDVVLVMDESGSMANNSRLDNAKKASKAFVSGLSGNSENRLAIVGFNDNGVDGTTHFALQKLTAANVTAANTSIDRFEADGWTNYIGGLRVAQRILNENKMEGRKQYIVFLSDGVPSRYRPISATSDTNDYFDFAANNNRLAEAWVTDGARNDSWQYEYYTTAMKAADITVYTVALGLGSDVYQAKYLLNDMSGPAGESVADNDTGSEKTKLNKYYFEVSDSTSAAALSTVFSKIAEEINAASNVQVNDLIADDYSMIFELPKGVNSADTNGQEFFIEVVNYALDENHDRTGASESLLRVYLESGTYKAYTVSTDTEGKETKTAVATAYTPVENNGKGYFKQNADGTYSYSVDAEGNPTGTHNITAGVHTEGSGENLILVTPYFTYLTKGQDLTWTTDKLSDKNQIAIRYFVYLENSAGTLNSGNADQAKEPGVYETNVEATVTYDNHLGHKCQQTFPVPQMTWSGAQVGVTFYLVNRMGQPINRSGEVVPLPAAAFVTETFYESVVWNTEKVDPLRATILAQEHLPEEYMLYDSAASYMVHVYKDTDNKVYDNFFKISGTKLGEKDAVGGHVIQNANTTHVYNTINGTKYTAYGVYTSTDKENVTYENPDTKQPVTEPVDFHTGNTIDYSSTNVAFAVLWIPTMAEDTFVADYGLRMKLNVVQNDQLVNTVHSVGTVVTNTTIQMNTGHASTSPIAVGDGATYQNSVLTLKNGDNVINDNGVLYYEQKDMEFKEPATFYYDSQIAFTNEGRDVQGYMYSKVTVIPATTVYFEDDFLNLTSYTKTGDTWNLDKTSKWTVAQDNSDIFQSTDRPGEDRYHLPGYDADNNYGYDSVYDNMSTHSLNSAVQITVNDTVQGEATFSFWGTGFDVISATSNTTGTLLIQLTDSEGNTTTRLVDTYYGSKPMPYAVQYVYDGENWNRVSRTQVSELKTNTGFPEEPAVGATHTRYENMWVPDSTSNNTLYQIPVMKWVDLEYGHYTVKIIASYGGIFDHNSADSGYTLYLDAIRIYDPTGNQNDVANEAYKKDKEGWPKYQELRNLILNPDTTIAANDKAVWNGLIFIDHTPATTASPYTIAEYKNYGPNNELYLAPGQSIAFTMKVPADAADVQIGLKSADGTAVPVKMAIMKSDGAWGDSIAIIGSDEKTATSTAVDRYYSIGTYVPAGGTYTMLFKNEGEVGKHGILSITNLKTTFEAASTNEISLGITYGQAAAAVMMLSAEAETVEPEIVLDADLQVSIRNKSVKSGSNVAVKATTSADVEYLMVNGQKVTKFTENKSTGKRSWSVNVKATKVGTMNIDITAYSADGDALETVTETVEVTAKKNGVVQQIVGQLIGMLGR